MATSRTEDMLAEVIAEFAGISVANGYRTTPKRVINRIRDFDEITEYPEIGVELGPERMVPIDDNWSVFDTTVEVFVIGAASGTSTTDYDQSSLTDATEALRHDIKRVIYKVMKKYINAPLSRWNVTPKQPIITTPVRGLGEQKNRSFIEASFTVRMRTQGAQFIDNGDAQDFGSVGGGVVDGGSI